MMKGLALIEPGKVEYINLEEPIIEDEYGCILKPIVVAPCTSDVHTIFHGGSPKKHNLILGHESVCEILEVGIKVKDFKPGEIVAVPAITPNWSSPNIEDGNFWHSEAPFSGHKLGRSINGVFEERLYFPNADMNLAKIPSNVSIEQALMSVDVVTTGFTAVEEANVQYGDNVVVFGIGAIGLMAIQGAKLKGAARIIAIGSRKKSIELAYEYGATDIINYKDGDVVNHIKELQIENGIDKVIICGGNDDTMRQAFDIVKYGTGIISNVALFTGTGDIPIPKFSGGKGLCGKTLKMSLCKGGRKRIERILSMISNGRFDPSALITDALYGIDKIYDGILKMKNNDGSTIKVAVYMENKND